MLLGLTHRRWILEDASRCEPLFDFLKIVLIGIRIFQSRYSAAKKFADKHAI